MMKGGWSIMAHCLKKLLRDEGGAVTVDWTALVAGSVLFAIAVVYAIFTEGVAPLSNAMSHATASIELPATPASIDYKQF